MYVHSVSIILPVIGDKGAYIICTVLFKVQTSGLGRWYCYNLFIREQREGQILEQFCILSAWKEFLLYITSINFKMLIVVDVTV